MLRASEWSFPLSFILYWEGLRRILAIVCLTTKHSFLEREVIAIVGRGRYGNELCRSLSSRSIIYMVSEVWDES